MINLQEIHKPKSLDEALALLDMPDTVAMAGGSDLIASRRRDVRAVVDLADLPLAYIRDKQGAVAIGAMTRLSEVADSPLLRAASNGLLSKAAHHSAASLMRNQTTVVGNLIAEPAGILAVALVALDAEVEIVSNQPITVFGASYSTGRVSASIADLLQRLEELPSGWLATEIVLSPQVLARRAAIEMVARTPRDRPIVTVCCSLETVDRAVSSVAIALGGVAETAVRSAQAERVLKGRRLEDQAIAEAATAAAEGLEPPADFRGSAEYRREMATVLVARALKRVERTQ